MKNAVQFIENYEEAVADEARRRGVDGVICGHIHKAEIRRFDDILYVNDGDWVESCTAIAEREDGELILLDWSREQKRLPSPARQGLVAGVPEASLAA